MDYMNIEGLKIEVAKIESKDQESEKKRMMAYAFKAVRYVQL